MIEIMVAMTIAYEASNQSFECQQWIARVIDTRVKERDLNPTQVVLEPNQFSCWDSEGQARQARKLTDRELSSALLAWKERHTVEEEPNLYHDTSVTPRWAKSPKVKFLKQIDDIRFYKEKRS